MLDQLRDYLPDAVVEVLTPDFNAIRRALNIVWPHARTSSITNLETVERLTPKVRSKATYRRSLDVLRYANRLTTKSGMMLGLGETRGRFSKL